MNLTEFASEVVPKIEETLATELKQSTTEKTLRDAMTYAVMAGGKRLRPLLTLAVAQSYGMDVPGLVRAASALELIHTYSLIHDDLPAMDNDDMRRASQRLTDNSAKMCRFWQGMLCNRWLING